MSHQYSQGRHSTKYGEMVDLRKSEDYTHQTIVNIYKKYTKKTKAVIEKSLLADADIYLKPNEVVKFGLADEVVDAVQFI